MTDYTQHDPGSRKTRIQAGIGKAQVIFDRAKFWLSFFTPIGIITANIALWDIPWWIILSIGIPVAILWVLVDHIVLHPAHWKALRQVDPAWKEMVARLEQLQETVDTIERLCNPMIKRVPDKDHVSIASIQADIDDAKAFQRQLRSERIAKERKQAFELSVLGGDPPKEP